MKRIATTAMMVVSAAVFACGQPVPQYIGEMQESEIMPTLRWFFSNASYEYRGLRLSTSESGRYGVVSAASFQSWIDWWYRNMPQGMEMQQSVIALVGVVSVSEWRRVPIGFAVRGEQRFPWIYAIFLTKEAGRVVVYRTYYDPYRKCPVFERMETPDCEVRLVVVF